jgi:serine/threonine protein kinase/tetratricopeptide (TPR) repeat protein
MTLTEPTHFGKYVLLKNIATGGMAELYLAKNTELKHVEKLIAIKRLLPHFASEENLVKSFIDEARLASVLQHQNIVQIYDCGTTEDSYYIEMEYLLGKDLAQVINKAKLNAQPLSLAYSLFIVAQICSGLDYAHKQKDAQGKPLNIIHRDISPQNIMMTYAGNVKIVDFGIAKAATQTTKTQVGMIKGKIAYMSPEQAEGKTIDHRSDIFSIGIILYELVTAKRMFQDEDTLKLLTLVRRAEFEPPERVNKALPPKLYEILHKSLAKEPEQRYQFTDEMLADLEGCMNHLPRPTPRGLSQYMHQLFTEEIAAESSMGELLPGSAGGDVKADREKATRRSENRDARIIVGTQTPVQSKRPWLWYAAVAEAVVLLGLGAYILLGGNRPIDVDVDRLQAQLRQATWQLETGQQRRVQLEAQVSKLQDGLQRHEQQAKQRQQELTAAQQEAQAARAESRQWQTRQQEATQQLQKTQADLERVKAEATDARTRLEAAVAQRTTEVTQTQAQYEQLRQQLETGKQGQGQLEAQVSQLQEALQRHEQQAKQRQQELTAAQREAQAARAESQQWQARQQEATQQLQKAQADLERVRAEATTTRARLETEVAQRTTEVTQAQVRYEQLRQQPETGEQRRVQLEERRQQEAAQRQQQAQDNETRGMEALTGGRCAEAVASFQTAVELVPAWKEKIKEPFARALQCRAASLPNKQSQEYETLLQKSIELDAKSVEGYQQLGLLYQNRKSYLKAMASYEKAIALDAQFHRAFFNLGLIYTSFRKDYVQAEKMFNRVVELLPDYVHEAYYSLAVVQKYLGKRDECLKNLERALTTKPEYPEAKAYKCG